MNEKRLLNLKKDLITSGREILVMNHGYEHLFNEINEYLSVLR